MKKNFLFVMILFGLISPCLALETPDLPSEVGKVEKVTYEDVAEGLQNENNVKQKVQIKVLTGQFKGIREIRWFCTWRQKIRRLIP